MTAVESDNEVVQEALRGMCPQCGAFCRQEEAFCWYCDHDLSMPASPPLRPGQFSIAMVLLGLTVAALCLGAFRWSFWLGILVLMLAVPALVRTLHASHAESRARRRLSGLALFGQFGASLMVVVVSGTCGLIVFAVTASFAVLVHVIGFAMGAGEPGVAMSLFCLAVSVFFGLLAALRVYWFFRPQ